MSVAKDDQREPAPAEWRREPLRFASQGRIVAQRSIATGWPSLPQPTEADGIPHAGAERGAGVSRASDPRTPWTRPPDTTLVDLAGRRCQFR